MILPLHSPQYLCRDKSDLHSKVPNGTTVLYWPVFRGGRIWSVAFSCYAVQSSLTCFHVIHQENLKSTRIRCEFVIQISPMHSVCLHADITHNQLWVSLTTAGGTGTQAQLYDAWKPLLYLTLKSPWKPQCEQGEVFISKYRHLKATREVRKSEVQALNENLETTKTTNQCLQNKPLSV